MMAVSFGVEMMKLGEMREGEGSRSCNYGGAGGNLGDNGEIH